MPERLPTDVAAAATALSSPWWLDLIQQGYQLGMAVGAAALLAGRLYLLLREIREKRQQKAEG